MATIKTVAPRVVGSDYTTFLWQGKPIARCTGVDDTGQKVLGGSGGAGFDVIHPLGSRYPTDIVTGRMLDVGTLVLTVTELWNAPAWAQLAGAVGLSSLTTAADLAQIFDAQSALGQGISAQMLIKPANSTVWRAWNYSGLTITGVDTAESIRISTISIARQIQCTYLKRTESFFAATGPITT